jgi:hypothetical protein
MLPKVLPTLCSSIQHLVTEEMLDEEEVDKTLIFHLLLLAYVSLKCGESYPELFV